MKLLYVTASLPFGRGEEFLIAEAKELLRETDSLLIVPRSPARAIVHGDARCLADASVRRSWLSVPILVSAIAEGLRSPWRCLKSLALLFRGSTLRVLAKNLAVFPKSLWLARLARRVGADHIHAHWATTTATMAMIASEVSGVPWSFTAHRGDIAENNLLALKLARAAFVRFISLRSATMASAISGGQRCRKAVVLHVGINVGRPRRPGSASDSPFRVLCSANLLPVKGHKYLIEAMAILRNRGLACLLQIVGEGALLEELVALTRALDCQDRVQFLGHVSHDRLIEVYRDGAVGALVLPSVDLGNHLHEGIPVSLMEAMAHGVPVIATRTGGIPELLGNGEGVLVPPEDPTALADAIARLAQSPALREELGRAGWARVAEDFNVERVTARLLAVMTSDGLRGTHSPLADAAVVASPHLLRGKRESTLDWRR